MNTRQLAFEGWLSGSDETETSDDWFTPPELVDLISDFFGGDIDLDPCASPHAYVGARVAYTKDHDGLSLPWVGHCIAPCAGVSAAGPWPSVDVRNRFVNPPYSNPAPWLAKLAALHDPVDPYDRTTRKASDGPGDSIALVKADPSTRAWQHAWSADAALFFKRRVQFCRAASRSVIRASAPFPSALLYWGPHADGFESWFGELGHVCRPTPQQIVAAAVERDRAEAITAVDEPIVLPPDPREWPLVPQAQSTIHCTCPTTPCPKHDKGANR